MKLNTDSSKRKLCKEEVLMCIFKDVPNFVEDDEKDSDDVEESWVNGSHQDLIIGKQGVPKSDSVTESNEKANLSQNWEQKESVDNNDDLKFKKCKRSSSVLEASTELELWSSPFLSEESIPKQPKKQQKTMKQSNFNKHNQLLSAIISTGSLNITNSLKKSVEGKFKDEELCDACQLGENNSEDSWLSLSENEDESEDEFMIKWAQASKKQLRKKPKQNRPSLDDSLENIPIKNCTKKEVMQLLNYVESNLLECSILLTTHKLHNKVRKARATGDDSMDKETPSDNDVVFDQLLQEEGTNGGSSKLCLALGRFVYKYLKVN